MAKQKPADAPLRKIRTRITLAKEFAHKRVTFLSKTEFSRATAIAQESEVLYLVGFMRDDNGAWSLFESMFRGDSIQTTIEDLARLIGYQCLNIDGTIDNAALMVVWSFRTKIEIVGSGSDEAMNMRLMRTIYKQHLTSIGEIHDEINHNSNDTDTII